MNRELAKKRLEVWLKCLNCPEDIRCYDEHLHTLCDDYDFGEDVSLEESIKVAISALSENRGEWIPIEDSYPEEPKDDEGYVYPSDYVLTFNACRRYMVSRYWGNRIRSKTEPPLAYLPWMDLPYQYQDVIAWQPLPEPFMRGKANE